MGTPQRQFTALARLLHWVMAAMVLAMFGIGTAMVASLGNYHALVSIHRPLGVAILLLAVVRLVNRFLNPPPPLPATVPRAERVVATVSEYTMYGLMFSLPLVGWGMLSAAHYPAVLWGSLRLPEILPHSVETYAVLRTAHSVLAYFFILMFVSHFAAILFHTLIVRDGIWKRMAPWKVRVQEVAADPRPQPVAEMSGR